MEINIGSGGGDIVGLCISMYMCDCRGSVCLSYVYKMGIVLTTKQSINYLLCLQQE